MDATSSPNSADSIHLGSPAPASNGSEDSLESHILAISNDDVNGGRSRSSTTSGFLNLINNGSVTGILKQNHRKGRLISLYRLLLLELNLPGPGSLKHRSAVDLEEEKRSYEMLVNMGKIPIYLEKFMLFGLLVCFNSFLTLFTLVPLKICIVTYRAIRTLLNPAERLFDIIASRFRFVKRDLTTLILIALSVYILGSPSLEVSRLYHDIRGQAHIKLYVMFGVLEVTDKLLSSLGQEILVVLLGIPVTVTSPRNITKLLLFFSLALLYSCCHSYVLIYQTVSLHVAANSYSNALLTLLLSNQFAELKGAVFKKFEREGLFQVTMSDLTERFQLTIMLAVIALRNIFQLGRTQLGLIPDSWNSWNKWIGAIFGPTVVVLGSEIFVDWVKHCFINKFNRIRPRVYDNFLYVLSQDFMEIFSENSKTLTLHEISDHILVTKRIGLPVMPLCICFLSMLSRDLLMVFLPSAATLGPILASLALISLALIAALVFRLLLSLWLLKWARHIRHNRDAHQAELRMAESKVREASGQDSSLKSPLDSPFDDNERVNSPGLELPMSPSPSEILLDTLPRNHHDDMDIATSSGVEKDDSVAYLNYELHHRSVFESETEIASSFIPGIPNTEQSSINPKTRSYLYDWGERVPPTLEEKRNEQVKQKHIASPIKTERWEDDLGNVHRYEMSSKRIW
ncbi:CIC11C00000001655 [Sungouiella intermedia]|uniref:CIC11C00000001655 n=1 Tax=Sungouiella intermedia TaxID=45354 RepID=A0A1L0DKC0_9ASCO|nr:CIC11C00000001655 [[Candida] intermedia]